MQPTTALGLASIASAQALVDLAAMQTYISSSANQIAASVIPAPALNSSNSTTQRPLAMSTIFPLSDTLMGISASLMQSSTNLNRDDNYTAGQSNRTIDAAYLRYVDTFFDLSQALISRGRAWHDEPNQPVNSGIMSIASLIYQYQRGMSMHGLITQPSVIRTLTAGSALIDAEGEWSMPGSLPGA